MAARGPDTWTAKAKATRRPFSPALELNLKQSRFSEEGRRTRQSDYVCPRADLGRFIRSTGLEHEGAQPVLGTVTHAQKASAIAKWREAYLSENSVSRTLPLSP